MKNNKWLLLLSVIFLLPIYAFVHEYHVSIFEIGYDQENKRIQISEKIFLDDLERALEEAKIEDLKLGSDHENEYADDHIGKFMTTHFRLFIGDRLLEQKYVGREWEDYHTLWVYFEINDVENIQELKVVNGLFTDLFHDQQNIHHFKINGVEKSVVLTRDNSETTFNFMPNHE